MSKEKHLADYYEKYKSIPNEELLKKLNDIVQEIEPFAGRPESEGFKVINESSNNAKFSALIQLLQERGLMK